MYMRGLMRKRRGVQENYSWKYRCVPLHLEVVVDRIETMLA
jgi:hypothetical protein